MTAPTMRELERRCAEIEAPEDLPTVGITTAFSAPELETEIVDRNRAIYRIDGRLWYDPDRFLDGSVDTHD